MAINVFVYLHGTPGRPVLQTVSQIAAIADTEPGTLLHADVAVAPGGNAVPSYLDVVAPDGITGEQVRDALEPAVAREGAHLLGPIGVRFHMLRAGGNPAAEFSALSARLLAVLRQSRSPTSSPRRPLDVVVRGGDADDLAFRLDGESARRVEALGGRSTGITLRVHRDAQNDSEAAFGAIYRRVLPVITNLELEQILVLGGVIFRDEESRKALWQWPKPGVDVRPPLDMGSLEHVVSMARLQEYQAVRADTINLLRREVEQSAADNPRLPTLTRWLGELEEVAKHG